MSYQAAATTNELGMSNAINTKIGTGGHGSTMKLAHASYFYVQPKQVTVVSIRGMDSIAYDLLSKLELHPFKLLSMYVVINEKGVVVNKALKLTVNGKELTIFMGKLKGFLVDNHLVRNPINCIKRKTQ